MCCPLHVVGEEGTSTAVVAAGSEVQHTVWDQACENLGRHDKNCTKPPTRELEGPRSWRVEHVRMLGPVCSSGLGLYLRKTLCADPRTVPVVVAAAAAVVIVVVVELKFWL